MRLRPNLALLSLDGDAVVFSEEAQHLLRLNPPAALLFRELRNGTRASELAHVLASEGLVALDEAEQWVTVTLDAFRSCGMLEDGPVAPDASIPSSDLEILAARMAAECAAYASFEPVAEERYRLLETCALIRFGHLAQVRLVRSVIGHLATDDHLAPSIVIDISAKMLDNGHLRSDVYRDGIAIGRAPRLSRRGPDREGRAVAIGYQCTRFPLLHPCRGRRNRCKLRSVARRGGKRQVFAYRGPRPSRVQVFFRRSSPDRRDDFSRFADAAGNMHQEPGVGIDSPLLPRDPVAPRPCSWRC